MTTVAEALATALRHHGAGDLPNAERLYRQILGAVPDHPDALHLLGVVAHQVGRNDLAVDLIQKSIGVRPGVAEVHGNLAHAFRMLGRLEDSAANYLLARSLNPRSPDASYNLAIVLQEMGRLEEATEAYRAALAINPAFPQAHLNLGNVLKDLGRLAEASASYRDAIVHKPDYPEAHNNLGVALHERGLVDEAVASCRTAIKLQPDYAEGHCNLALALAGLGHHDEAVASHGRALFLKPDFPDAYHGLGTALQELGRRGESVEAYRQAVRLRPDFAQARLDLAHQQQHICDWTDRAVLEERILGDLRDTSAVLTPFPLLAMPTTADDQLQCALRWANSPRFPVANARVHGRARQADRIRIGYLSNDFHQHATAYLTAGLFERHDRTRFEIVGYSYGIDDHSDTRARLIAAFDRFVDIRDLDHAEAAARIYADDIDILVDLKGYTGGARTEIPASRPAPIQVGYLGYPGTMGADFIDYIIADTVVAPSDHQPFYTERLVHLPHCYQVNDSGRAIAERTPSRAEAGLPEHGFVFCCFNSSYKIAPAMFDIWTRLLRSVPGSILWLLDAGPLPREALIREAAARDVTKDRLVFAPAVPLPDHLARHRLADLFLDTLPYNAHTTASDALWAGLPVVTCLGETFAGRVAASLLTSIGAADLVTASVADYEALALRLAGNADMLAEVRHRIAVNRLTTPLFDTAGFTRDLETAYETMWAIHGRAEPPRPFAVPPSRKLKM